MIVLWILFLGGLVVLPGTALLAIHWAMRNGEFKNLPKIALSIFDEEEPVGTMTDHFPQPAAPGNSRGDAARSSLSPTSKPNCTVS